MVLIFAAPGMPRPTTLTRVTLPPDGRVAHRVPGVMMDRVGALQALGVPGTPVLAETRSEWARLSSAYPPGGESRGGLLGLREYVEAASPEERGPDGAPPAGGTPGPRVGRLRRARFRWAHRRLVTAVARGADILDNSLPGWHREVPADEIAEPHTGVLAHLYGDWASDGRLGLVRREVFDWYGGPLFAERVVVARLLRRDALALRLEMRPVLEYGGFRASGALWPAQALAWSHEVRRRGSGGWR